MKGIYKGYEYRAFLSEMGHLCGYVKLPDDHPYNKLVDKRSWANFAVSSWKMDKSLAKKKGEKFDKLKPKGRRVYFYNGYGEMDIDVHGGLTFTRRIKREGWPQKFSLGAWIGWDYAHAGDYIPATRMGRAKDIKEIHWQAEAVVRDCKDVIRQLIKIAEGEK